MKKLMILLLAMAVLSGCAVQQSQVLVNNSTGQIVRCANGAWGWGLAGALAMASAGMSQEQCIRNFKQVGFIEIEKAATIGTGFNVKEPLSEAIVMSVLSGSPADKAGIKVGDKIIERNGISIKCVGDLLSMPRLAVGEEVEIKILRNGQESILKMKTIKLSDALQQK